MASTPDLPTACPSCGAAVRTAVAWCTLCYSSLVPVPVPVPTGATQVAVGGPGTAGEPAPIPRRGRHSRDVDDERVDGEPADTGADVDTAVPTSEADVELMAAGLLAELAATRDPQPAWMQRLPSSTGGRVALIGGAVAVGTLLLVAAMSLIGLFL